MVLHFEEETDTIVELVPERYWAPSSRPPSSQHDVMDDFLDKPECLVPDRRLEVESAAWWDGVGLEKPIKLRICSRRESSF